MNFEPLYELKNRLENVAVVGINLIYFNNSYSKAG